MMNILYVEDDPRDADLTRRELASSAPDLRLDVVATLQEALVRLEGEPAYDLLLTDLRLPDGDGLTLLAHIRERALPLAVVIVTGRGDEETVVAALRAGADDYVVKRAGYLAHLPKVLADALYRYRVQAERRARPLRVLYAEPNASDADLTHRHLARYAPHIHLEVVSAGRQALQRLPDTPAPPQEITCDLLLLDYRLPGMDALEVLKEVRQVRGLDLPVALVSGRGKPEVVLQALKLGAADYLPKNPGYLFRLPAVLENTFHRAQLAREQAALRASEAQYRTLFEGVPIGLYRTTPAGRILDANPALVHMLGYPDRESLLATEATGMYVNPQDRQRWRALLEREGVVTDFEVQLRRGDGATIWVQDNAHVARDAEGRAVHYEGSLEDVTARKQVEEALAEERNLLRTLIDNMPDYIFVKDAESRFITTNTAHLRTLGVETVEEVIGKTDLSFFPQELAAQYYADEQAVVSSGQPLLNRVERAIDPEGEDQWLLTSKVPLRDSNGSIMGLVGMSRDISELKGAEEALERQNERLQALYRAGQLLNSSLEIDTILDHLVDEAMRVARASHGQVLVARQESSCFERHSLRGFSLQEAELARTIPLPLEEGLNGQVYRTGQTVCVDDVQATPDYFPLIPSTRAELVVPIVRDGQILGNLDLQSPEAGAFRNVDLGYLDALTDRAAIALENARLFQETQQQLRELGLLFDASAALATGLEPAVVLQATAQQITAALAVEGCTISSWDRNRDALVTLLDYSPELTAWNSEPPGTLYRLADYPASRRVVTGRQPAIVQVTDPEADPAEVAWMTAQGVKSLLMVPLVARDQAIGLLELMEGDEPRAFTPAEIRLAQTLSNLAAAALENARLFDETRRRNQELALLNQVIAASAASQESEPILEMVCRELALAFGLPQSAAALLNAERTEAVVVAEYLAQGRTSVRGKVIPVKGDPSFQHLLEHQAPLVVDDAQTDPRLAPIHDIERRRGTVSLLLLPLIIEGEVVGSLGVDAIERRPFSTQEVELAQRVAEQVSGTLARARLREERQQLEEQFRQAQKMEAIGRLAGGIAHDFNNLLTVIHLSTRLLDRDLHPQDPLYQHVQRIQDAGRRATNLTKQLLAFSRREIVEPQILNLNDLIGDLSKMLRRIIGEDVELVMDLVKDLWPVEIDPTQVDQVLMNLAVNARDAMPAGGRLTIATANAVLDEAYTALHLEAQPGEYVLLSVSDTGVGMSDEVKAHLFEPFFTTKEKGKGTGLGLATVYGIVKQNGGHISVYSEEGLGTTLRIYLPHSRAEQTQAPSRAAPARLSGGTETILVVEDRTDVRDLTVQVLSMHGYQVFAAGDGTEALQVGRGYDGPIHLLLTDLVMPDMNGRELAEQLRLQRPEMRVSYMSAYADRPLVKETMADPGVTFLPKPFTVESLIEKVRAVLDET